MLVEEPGLEGVAAFELPVEGVLELEPVHLDRVRSNDAGTGLQRVPEREPLAEGVRVGRAGGVDDEPEDPQVVEAVRRQHPGVAEQERQDVVVEAPARLLRDRAADLVVVPAVALRRQPGGSGARG